MRILKKGASIYAWKNIQLIKSRIFIFSILFIISIILFVMYRFPYITIGLIMMPISYVLGIYTYKKYIEWNSGIGSENLITKELENLDDSYYLISGVVVPPNRGDTDHIVIGRNGIFVIESKNYGGRIECNSDKWSRYKVGRGGKRYELTIGSPSNQVKRNAKVLKDFILEHSDEIFKSKVPHIWVHTILIFTNPNVELSIKNPTVDIIPIEKLCDFIKKQKSEHSLMMKKH